MPGKRHGHGLADMSGREPERIYQPPPERACEVIERSISLDSGVIFTFRQHVYRGKVVDFALMLRVDGVEISRIDTAHGTVHEHILPETERDETRTIDVIPVRDYDFVNQAFDTQYDIFMSDLNNKVQRWRNR